MTENTICLFMMRSFIFVKMIKNTYTLCQTMCNNACLLSDLETSQWNEPQQFCIITHLESDQLKACSDCSAQSRNSLVFPNLMVVRPFARCNDCSSFQIQLCISHFHPQVLSSLFLVSIAKLHVFMSFCVVGFLWTRNLYLPLDSDLTINYSSKW